MPRINKYWNANSDVSCTCQTCTKRYVGCHSKCKDYLDFKRRVKELRVQEKKDKPISDGWARESTIVKGFRRKYE